MNLELLRRALDALENVCLDSDRASKEDTLLHTSAIAELRAALAVGDSASPGEPVAYMTMTDDGDPAMLFFDLNEALRYCNDAELPEPLYTHAIPPDVQLDAPTKTDLARIWREVNGSPRWPSDVDAFVDAWIAAMTAPKVTP